MRLSAIAMVNDLLMWFGLPAFMSVEASEAAAAASAADSGNDDQASNFDSILEAEQGIVVPQTRVT